MSVSFRDKFLSLKLDKFSRKFKFRIPDVLSFLRSSFREYFRFNLYQKTAALYSTWILDQSVRSKELQGVNLE